jgi:hypothetical protein
MKTIRASFLGTALLMGFSVQLTNGQQSPWPPDEYEVLNRSQGQDRSPATVHPDKAQLAGRQKKLVADTDRLLALATDLKAQVDKSPAPNTLSLDEIKKADEIEKLAHSVKQDLPH